jgi:hypothetical protein
MKILSMLSVALLVSSSMVCADQPLPASTPQQGQTAGAQQAAKIKAQVQKRGAGEKSKVRVTLANAIKVRGYISRIDESSFDVSAGNSARPTSISYTDVQKIQGPGLSTGAKIAIGVVVGVAVVATVIGIGLGTAKGHVGI